jgi:hypothetical protein
VCANNVAAQNLLANSDFTAGNTGFQSSYSYTVANNGEGQYTVAANPHAWNQAMVSSPPWMDHTPTGDNLSLLVNGSPTAGLDFWRETVAVQSHTSYELSGWASDIYPGPNSSRATLQAYVNGLAAGSPVALADGEPNWQHFSVVFDSGSATSVTVSLRDLNLLNAANDFAVDDLSVAPVPEPSAIALLALGLVGLLARLSCADITGRITGV